jgi:hypothetical protein
MYNEIELMEMTRDYEAMERVALQDAEELRQLREGERIIVPVDMEHARTMFKLASFYLSQHDKEFDIDLSYYTY